MNLLALLLPTVLLLQPVAPPKFTARLYAAADPVAPGGQTELAIELNLEKGWHTYHPLILDTGKPTEVEFTAPAGVSFGELRFPVPEPAEDHELRYLALSGRFVLLTTLRLAPDVPPGPLTIKADVFALVCKELCVPAETDATLTLQVGTATATSRPAAVVELFKEAREALPAPLEKAKYLEGSSVSVSRDKLTFTEEGAESEPAEVVVKIKVRKGHHIQDRDPGVEGLIPTRLFIEPLDGLKFGEQQWPAAHVREMPDFGKVREQNGEFKIRVPLSIIDTEFAAGPVALRLLFVYQCCTDAGTCYPPETAEAVVRFTADTATPRPAEAGPLGTLLPRVTVGTVTPKTAVRVSAATDAAALWWNLLLGFVGGLILNVMPCVFPVISIKIIGFVKQAGEDRGRIFRLGLAFCAGIMVWFWVFGILTGQGHVPWQNPWVVITLTSILFLFALNLFGVFEIILPGAAAGALDEAAGREGYGGAFLKGLLATLMGTACTAPFFASAAAYAATQGQTVALLIFTGAGLGMSSPYLLLSAYPGWLRALPKPGPWMITFKQAMGFLLIGTAIWLLLVIADQLDAQGVAWTVGFCTFLAFSAWLVGRIDLNWNTAAKLRTWVSALAVTAGGVWFCFFYMYDVNAGGESKSVAVAAGDVDGVIRLVAASDWNGHIPWQPWQPGLDEELARRGYTVYVDFTATWCITCQTNKATAVEIDATRNKMEALGIIPLKADYTKRDPAIRERLLAFGHNSVPLNLIYPAGRPQDVIHLPVILTPGIVAEALEKAGASRRAVAAEPPDL
jgi:thiol:disulfide interchange protein DsbD